MAVPGNNRLLYSRTSFLGQRLDALTRALVSARQQAQELARIVAIYGPDSAGLAADLGAPDASQVPAFQGLLTGAANELGATATTAIAIGATTLSRQLADVAG